MCQYLRHTLHIPLGTRNFHPSTDLLDARFYRPRPNGTQPFGLEIVVVDNPMTMFDQILTEVLGLLASASLE